jgi:hypothetical protein
MSIINFTIPSDSKILEDIELNNIEIKFIGLASVNQNIKETVFTRMLQFSNENVVKKAIYKKKGISWGFESLEIVNF